MRGSTWRQRGVDGEVEEHEHSRYVGGFDRVLMSVEDRGASARHARATSLRRSVRLCASD
jgi:hypothetical protein